MTQGFYWTANSPYIQGMWVRVRRAPRAAGLSTTIADGFIPTVLAVDNGRKHYNANPAYLIYECITNTDWGMGGSPDDVDPVSFNYAAQVFRNENAGLFMLWSQQTAIEEFVGDVIDHIQASLYVDPSTGLWTLKPFRADYVVDDLPLLTPDNCDISDFDRREIADTINEIVVTWTNPATEQTETITVQDLSNIVLQNGQIVSDTRNYYGFRESAVALAAATRELRSASAPLVTCTIKADRRQFAMAPGDCLRLYWPEEDADEIFVMRVQSVDYGSTSDSAITLNCIQDIFALDAPVYIGAPNTGWESPDADPNPPANALLTTVPAFVVANSIAEYVTQPVDPEVNTLLLVADPNPDFTSFEPYTDVTLANGSTAIASTGTSVPAPYCTLPAALGPEIFSTVTAFNSVSGRPPQLADLVFIGSSEIALVQSVATDGSYTLARGVLDTVPQAWPAGTSCWLVGSLAAIDTTARAPGETVSYRLLMRTSRGLLAYEAAPDATVTLTDRPYLPLRPANVQVNGIGFGTAALAGADATVTWANRNRLLETATVLNWGAGTVAPENDQNTVVEVLASDGSVAHSYTAVGSATSQVVPAADLAGNAAIRVASIRDGNRSLQAFTVAITP